MLVWIAPGWMEHYKIKKEELTWFAEQIEPRYKQILEKMVEVAKNSESCMTVELGKGPRDKEYFLEIFQIDPEDMDFAQMLGVAPEMGIALDILASGEPLPSGEPCRELVGHAYEDGRKEVTFAFQE